MAYAAPDNTPLSPEPNYAPETPRLETVLAAFGKSLSLGLRVAVPGQIVAIDAEQPQTVDVLPLFKTRTFGNKTQDMPVLRGVPVMMPQGYTWRVSYPIAVGDTGLCVFADRNMDAFLSSDGTTPQDPQDNRSHDLNDAVFIPGLVPGDNQPSDTNGDLVLQNGDATVRLGPGGTLSVQNQLHEALALLVQGLQAQANALSTLGGASIVLGKFDPATTTSLSLLQSTVASLHDSLKTFQA